MSGTLRVLRAPFTILTTITLAVVSLLTLGAAPAAAAPTPLVSAATDPPPPTVTADALPTWQINGVVWSQAIIGDTVYVTGSFTRARPPGVAAGGAGEVVANNIFAYRLSTGDRVTTFATSPGLNAQGLVIRASADGSRLYVGGDFTTANGTARGHVVALNPADGSLVSGFAPNVGGQVRGFGLTTHHRLRRRQLHLRERHLPHSPGRLPDEQRRHTNWAPAAAGGYVWAMTMTPDN